MSQPPVKPKIYHITHVDNLPSIIANGELISDAAMIARGGPTAPVGMSAIKKRRLGLPVSCHCGDNVGDYVPFYFCPRSIMLFVLHCANHPDLTYHGGQEPIVHLQADLYDVIAWADSFGRHWAFSPTNAGATYTQFSKTVEDLSLIDWKRNSSTDFRTAEVKEAKQAEFLVHGSFPWNLIERIGVHSQQIKRQVEQALQVAQQKPVVEIRPTWYF